MFMILLVELLVYKFCQILFASITIIFGFYILTLPSVTTVNLIFTSSSFSVDFIGVSIYRMINFT